jgi:hypothetical protein
LTFGDIHSDINLACKLKYLSRTSDNKSPLLWSCNSSNSYMGPCNLQPLNIAS